MRLPYSDIVPPAHTPGPWSDWLRTLASSCSDSDSNSYSKATKTNSSTDACATAVAVDGLDLEAAIKMPLYEAVPYLQPKAEGLLAQATQYLSEPDWADWLKIPLIGAASQGDFKTVSALLKAGAVGRDRVVGAWMNPGGGGCTLLHSAADGGEVSVVEALLEAGAGVAINTIAGDGRGFSPFHVAAIRGSVPVAMALARAGAGVHRRAPYDQTALHLAASTGRARMIRSLVVDLRLVIGARDNVGGTALHAAAWHGKEKCTRTLLHLGAEVDAQDSCGRSALFQASRCGGRTGCKVMRELLHASADVRIASYDGDTPLHVACRYGHVRAVHLLLRHDADENVQCDLWKTPKHVVMEAQHRRVFTASKANAICDALAAAPAGRAWRRRGWLIMLRARSAKFHEGQVDTFEKHRKVGAKEGAAGRVLLMAEEANGLLPSPFTSNTASAKGGNMLNRGCFFTALRKALGDEKKAKLATALLEGEHRLREEGAEYGALPPENKSGSAAALQRYIGGEPQSSVKGVDYSLRTPQQHVDTFAAAAASAAAFTTASASVEVASLSNHQALPLHEVCESVQAGILDLTSTDGGHIDAGERRAENFADRTSKACRRRAAREKKAFGGRVVYTGNGEALAQDKAHDLVIRTFEMADFSFEIMCLYL